MIQTIMLFSGLSLKTGPMSANIQLGAAPQGAMIKLDAKCWAVLRSRTRVF